GGDTAVMFKDNPATRALIKYLASPEAGTIWAKRGGFSSPNKKVPASAYPDPITRVTATALAKAPVFRFDMSDLQPAWFGGTVGPHDGDQGERELARRRAGGGDGDRADLRSADRADPLVGRNQDGGRHADGDLALRHRRDLAHDGTEGSEQGHADRSDRRCPRC